MTTVREQTILATRHFDFCAGHRLLEHEGRCAHLHGHNYRATISVRQREPGALDDLGRVIDFDEIKRTLGAWIDKHLDHAFIVWSEDVEAQQALNLIDGQRVYRMGWNPTAENIARELVDVASELLPEEIIVDAVRVQETPNCYADVLNVNVVELTAIAERDDDKHYLDELRP